MFLEQIGPSLKTGTARSVGFDAETSQGAPTYEFLQNGRFRLGVQIEFFPADAVEQEIEYEIRVLGIEISGYPFGFIP